MGTQVALTLLLLAQVVASLFVTVETFQFHFGIVPQSEVDAGPLPKVQVRPRPSTLPGSILMCCVRSTQPVRSMSSGLGSVHTN